MNDDPLTWATGPEDLFPRPDFRADDVVRAHCSTYESVEELVEANGTGHYLFYRKTF